MPAARRRVVPAGREALDHEAVGPGGGVGDEHLGQVDGRDDRLEPGPAQRRLPGRGVRARVEPDGGLAVRGGGALDPDRHLHRFVARQPVEQTRQVGRVSGAHQHVVDAGQHRAVARVRDRQVDLAEVVDAHLTVMALLGEVDLDEVGGDGEFGERPGRSQAEPQHGPERHPGRRATGHVVGAQDPFGHAGQGEPAQRPAHVAARVALLQPAGADEFQRGAGHHPELAGQGDRPGESPAGYRDPHAALDDPRFVR